MTEPSPISTSKRAAQGRATRDQLIEVATQLFAERGYEDTSIEAVLSAAGVSRGALYHHFAGKDALFEAVVASVEQRVNIEMAAAIGAVRDPIAVIRAGALAWIGLAGDPVIQRIMLTDAPAVLGWERWRTMDEGRTYGQARALLQAVSDAGQLPAHLVGGFAHIILGAIDEMAVVIARAPDKEAALAEGRVAVDEMLRRLLGP
ncbi:MAG: TetR/AcrR family transcriptional regulator [Trebonia sp.]|uniref:TetR/AcrR family transcriptional regulator n=1 Tax=Trebonia sp. TaxID=2767075 RepID=UPI003BB14D83